MNPQINNMIDAYQNDPTVRDRLNKLGIYLNIKDNISLTYYITDEILDAGEYHDFMELAINLSSNDSIIFIINSPGGYKSGAQMLITGINSSDAESTAVVIDSAASAATIIALACDNLVMVENSHFMVHAVAFGSGGKLHEITSHTEFTIRKSKEFIESVYKDFLTPEEIQQVIEGKDFYFDDVETMQRWDKVMEAREVKLKAEEAEHIKAHIEALTANLDALKAQLPEQPVKPKRTPKKV